jgi:hypothetical protein
VARFGDQAVIGESAVLVDVRQLGKIVKPAKTDEVVLPSVVRLNPLDLCPCTTGEVSDRVFLSGVLPASASPPPIGLPGLVDRKLRVSSVRRRVLARPDDVQSIGKMIECASHVVDALPDPHGPLGRYLLDGFDSDADAPVTVTICSGFEKRQLSPRSQQVP